MNSASVRKVYENLSKYFGLRARDQFLITASGQANLTSGESSTSLGGLNNFIGEIFGDGVSFQNDDDLFANLTSDATAQSNIVCVTTTTNKTSSIKKTYSNKPQTDQGWGSPGQNSVYCIEDCGIKTDNKNITAYQVFPVAAGVDVSDTDVVSLFMNSLTTLHMSQATPYMDVKIVGVWPEGNKASPTLSLGKFLGSNVGDVLNQRFKTNIRPDAASNTTLDVVAGMEVFTTPQTLVNAENVGYNRMSGGRVDAFRPLMAIKSLEISDVPSGAGTISYKSANLSLTLFDKGRLSEIAQLVAPRRDGNLKFQITYGWSHPDGKTFERISDADQMTRIGHLIDSMKVSETFTLVNSSYSFQQDGSVDISLMLAMDGITNIFNKDVLSSNVGGLADVSSIISEIDGVVDLIRNSSNSPSLAIDIPQVLSTASPDNILQLNEEALKELRSFAASLKKGKSPVLKDAADKILAIFNPNGNTKDTVQKAKMSREALAVNLVKTLRETPDPFLRPVMKPPGVTEKSLGGSKNSSSIKQEYVSLGKLMIHVLGDKIGDDNTDVQFVFTAFNHNAAAMFDHNIAQFPINLSLLEEDLKEEYKKRNSFTADQFVRFVNEKYIQFSGNSAYGLSQIYETDKRPDNEDSDGKYRAEIIKKVDSAEGQANIQNKHTENLKSIYGQSRNIPTFTIPRVNVRFLTRQMAGDGNSQKTVIRIFFTDIAAGKFMPIADSIMTLISKNYFLNQGFAAVDTGARSARHDDVNVEIQKMLVEKNYIEPLTTFLNAGTDDTNKVVQKIEVGASALKTDIKNLRQILLETSPYLLFGTEGSGIIEATLQSEQNDVLTSIYFAKRFSGVGSAANGMPAEFPFEVHPATLSLTTFGCPLLHLVQKYFVDLGTGTTVDNFYVVANVVHTITSGEYKTTIELKPYDAYGRFINAQKSTIEKILQIKAEYKRT